MNKKIKLILETVVICIILFSVFYTGFMAYSKRLTYDKMETDNSSYTPIETIDDQEVHIDGFPVIYIEGNNEIDKDDWETFSSELQKYCNVPWLTKNVSSIYYCSEDIFYNALGEKQKLGPTSVEGFTDLSNNSVYIKETDSEGYDETIIHEFGHVYDCTYQITDNYDLSILENNQKKICKNNVLDYSNCHLDYSETFADAIMLYILYPEAGYLPEEVFNWIDTLPR